MKIYLASPFFNEEELRNVQYAEMILRKRGYTIFSPRENEVRDETVGTLAWSLATFQNDRKYIEWADVVVMLYYGACSDSGTAWECGYAYGIHKPVVVVQMGDISNLMVHEGSHANITLPELKTYDFDVLPALRYQGKMI